MKHNQTIRSLLITSANDEADVLINMYDRRHYKVTNATLPKLKLLYLVRELTKGELDELILAYEHTLQDRLSRYTYNVQPTITPSTLDTPTRDNFVDGFNKPATRNGNE